MMMKFKKIDKSGFIRIWNSDFQDGFMDSHKKSFEETPEDEWKVYFEKHLRVMREVELNGELIGYIFLSSKADGSAHLGYGLYKEHRGKGYSLKMCQQFLINEIPNLDKEIKRILATTLKDNKISQKILKKLGFIFLEELDDREFDYVRFERGVDLNGLY